MISSPPEGSSSLLLTISSFASRSANFSRVCALPTYSSEYLLPSLKSCHRIITLWSTAQQPSPVPVSPAQIFQPSIAEDTTRSPAVNEVAAACLCNTSLRRASIVCASRALIRAGFGAGPSTKRLATTRGLGNKELCPETCVSRQESWLTILSHVLKLSGS